MAYEISDLQKSDHISHKWQQSKAEVLSSGRGCHTRPIKSESRNGLALVVFKMPPK